jgi:hypothetical protein
MTSIQALGDTQSIAQLWMNSQVGANAPATLDLQPQGLPAAASTITNDKGQTLLDIQDQLKTAIQGALDSSSGNNPRVAIQQAVDSTLQKNGFDVQQVKDSMKGAQGAHHKHHHAHGAKPAGDADASNDPFADPLTDPTQSALQNFLNQLPAGANLDTQA